MIINDGTEMILLPAGEFTMGSPACEGNDDERRMHRLHVDAFYMDKYEVTAGQYRKLMYATGHVGLANKVIRRVPPTVPSVLFAAVRGAVMAVCCSRPTGDSSGRAKPR